MLGVIRELFASGGQRGRDEAIREAATALGYARVGSHIREVLRTDIRTAVRRGILEECNGKYRLLVRQIDGYTRDHLVDMLVAAMGNAWQTRDEATSAAARHLGFRRTGSKIRAAFKSAINAAIRRGLIERDGNRLIRKSRR